ncbi:hypothetical protein JB92DRAFT_328243 [Gautieria morchelliformis]|nr:hypothetical protein JB92DRAFT_328243 [Gautieria morchelliformis]
MMGPRMFPLYSKGVETYRFEYGVFLLNKNIEMLMMDRNLHVMDMRHTLPNLKNLLLTLTTGEEIKPISRLKSPLRAAHSPDMRSCSRPISPLSLDAESVGSQTVTHSGFPVSRKSTPFLSPLAAILRSRYPSSAGRPTVRVVDEAPEPTADDDESVEDDTEQARDRETVNESLPMANQVEAKSTIRTNVLAYSPSTSNGHGRPFEKLANVDDLPTPPPPLPGVT